MATKKMLVAITDTQDVAIINQALGDEWLTTPVTNETDAIALLETAAFDAAMVDFNLGSPDASELVNAAMEKCPQMTQFLFAYEADLALVAAKVLGEPEILPKPLEAESITSRIKKVYSGTVLEEGTATGFDTASSIPPIYSEILQALASPDVTCEQVGNLIAQDSRLLEETLMLTRSAYFGLPRNLARPADAVEALGLDTIKALVMAQQFMAEHSHVRPGYLSLEKIWQHSIHVGQIARDLVLLETKNRTLAMQALTAGLVHDLGKVVLASNFDDLYGRVHSLAQKQPVALWDIEKEMFGANHGEIGACLLGMWNLPVAVVDAAAHHHEPPMGEQNSLSPLVAVHIANVLEHQLRPANEFRVVPVVNAPFLNELGLLQRLPVWRATFANQLARAKSAEMAQVKSSSLASESVTISETANPPSSTDEETRTATTAPTAAALGGLTALSRTKRWVYIGAVAVAMFSLGLLSKVGLGFIEPTSAHAKTPSHQELALASKSAPSVPAMIAATPAITTAPSASTAATPTITAPASASNSVPETKTIPSAPAPTAPKPEPVLVAKAVSATTVTTNAPLVAAEKKVFTKPSLHLSGIFYTASKRAAIVNGQTVFVGEVVDGAMVVSINQNSVTLALNGKHIILSVPDTLAAN